MGDIAVLIVADGDDPHARLVDAHLAKQGVSVATLNLGNLRHTPLSLSEIGLAIGSDHVSGMTSVWWHRAGTTHGEGLDEEERRLVADENPHFLKGALDACGVRWIDPPHIVSRAETKLLQLSTARQLGIRTPQSLVTNVRADARRFESGRRFVTKALSPGLGIAPFTDEVLADELNAVAANPVLLQELVNATADARVVVVDGKSWVWMRPRARDVIDWRAEDPRGEGFHRADQPELGSLAAQITSALQLTMSVQDWLLTPDGPVFLEINPQGGWHFLDGAESTVAPALASHLAEAHRVSEGSWPPAIKRFRWDFRSAAKAPDNDGVVPPRLARPTWIDEVAAWDGALEIARRSNDAAQESARTAEDKASRLVQVSLALITVAIALATFQLTAAVGMWWPRLLLVLPAIAAIALIALAAIEALEIDRVGVYGHAQPGDLRLSVGRTREALALEAEERGRQLARWTANRKLSELMQARAWFSRGLAALLLAALIAGATFALDSDEGRSADPAGPQPTTVTPTTP